MSSVSTPAPFHTSPVRAGRALARLSRILEQASSEAGLSLAQYRVLALVADRPQRASALAARVDVQRATLSAVVGGLERAGLLERRAVAGDGRGVQLGLTVRGRAALASVDRHLGAQLVEMAAAGSVGEMETLAGLLEGLVRGFEVRCVVEPPAFDEVLQPLPSAPGGPPARRLEEKEHDNLLRSKTHESWSTA